jgi:hypothetical protein
MKARRSSFVTLSLLIAGAVLIAATWHGTYDVAFDPRNRTNDEDARNFIRGTVNASPQVVIWRAGDSLTLCQGSSCAIYVYAPNGTWQFGRAIDSRSRPPESWLERLIRWLLGQDTDPGNIYDTYAWEGELGSAFGECFGIASGVRVSYQVDGYYRHGYVNGQYAGSVFVGTSIRQYETTGSCV